MDLAARWEAHTAAEALDRAADHEPDLALVDITLKASGGGGAAGLDLIKRLRRLEPAPRVLAVSMHDEVLYAQRALAAGAQGYIMKRSPDKELVRAVRRVLGGRLYVSDAVRERLMKTPEAPDEVTAPVDTLSDRELEVFLLIGQGFAPRHIADQLDLSVKTIETHRRHLKRKLRLETSAELVRYAVAWRKERSVEDANEKNSSSEEPA